MNRDRFHVLTSRYASLRIGIIGDFCLDRYFEIDPARQEISIETGLPVHNIVNVRCQPGAAGTILNNLVSLGVRDIYAVGFCGEDGEGYELRRSLASRRGVRLDHFISTAQRKTFTYTKPLVLEPGKPPVELNRLDIKNWSATPEPVVASLAAAVRELATRVDALILMDQVDLAETGVVTQALLHVIAEVAAGRQNLLVLADSRRGLQGFPKVTFKMNGVELARITSGSTGGSIVQIRKQAETLAARQGKAVFVTLADQGIVGATPDGRSHHSPSLPLRGEIDIVGAGDSVTANLTAALAAGATVPEALELAMSAASIVIHQLGTTGTASVEQLSKLVQLCA